MGVNSRLRQRDQVKLTMTSWLQSIPNEPVFEITVFAPVTTFPTGAPIPHRTVAGKTVFRVSRDSPCSIPLEPTFPSKISELVARGENVRDTNSTITIGGPSVFPGQQIATCGVDQFGDGKHAGEIVASVLFWLETDPSHSIGCVFRIPWDGTDVELSDFELTLVPVPPEERSWLDRITRAPTHRVRIEGPHRP